MRIKNGKKINISPKKIVKRVSSVSNAVSVVIENSNNKDDCLGIDSVKKTHQNIKRAKKTIKKTKSTVKKTKKVIKHSKQIIKLSIKVTQKSVKATCSFVVKHPIIAIIIGVLVISFAMSSDDNIDEAYYLSVTSLCGYTKSIILTDQDTIDKYIDYIKQLDDEFKDNINNSYEDEKKEVDIIGDLNSNVKDILAILSVIKEQDIEYINENKNIVKKIHGYFFTVDEEYDEYSIKVIIRNNSFDMVLSKLDFNIKQKKWAEELRKVNYKEIYDNLN